MTSSDGPFPDAPDPKLPVRLLSNSLPRLGVPEPSANLTCAMQERWTELTQFLRVPGAPLDNNVTERILKMSILHRKNSLFYRTQQGAQVGDLFMSLVQTCRANEINPFDYLVAVVRHAPAAKADPDRWLPWNYQANLAQHTALSA